jgi:hypothetical protein
MMMGQIGHMGTFRASFAPLIRAIVFSRERCARTTITGIHVHGLNTATLANSTEPGHGRTNNADVGDVLPSVLPGGRRWHPALLEPTGSKQSK